MIKGYALLTSMEGVTIGIPENMYPEKYKEVKEQRLPKVFPIFDIAVDENSFLLLGGEGTYLLDVPKQCVGSWFKCKRMREFLLPAGMQPVQELVELGKRTTLNKPYTDITRKVIVANSLAKGYFDDSFLFT